MARPVSVGLDEVLAPYAFDSIRGVTYLLDIVIRAARISTKPMLGQRTSNDKTE
jgi:hypothetical protein